MALSTNIDKLFENEKLWQRLPRRAAIKRCFRLAMRGRRYDYASLLDAWNWFQLGWGAHMIDGEGDWKKIAREELKRLAKTKTEHYP